MKKFSLIPTLALAFLMIAGLGSSAIAQELKIQNWRPYDQRGINVFEPAKDMTTPFNGLKVRVGGSFTQQFQALSHSNNADPNLVMYRGQEVDANSLYDLAPGFNLAAANLNIDVQLADGIRISLENYMSSRHHPEFWVKGGYIQIDKLPMFGNPDWFAKNFRVKIGHFQVNYGDQQFRRSDNGNTMYNPFVGNYIMDAFTTEIGSELYYFNPAGLMVMAGITSGYINGNIQAGENRAPSIYGKIAYDKQINNDLRVRLSASGYMNSGVGRNTLFAGDRAGSRFYLAMEPAYYLPRGASAYTAADASGLFTSGRLNGGFANEVATIMINPFIKFKGLEVFGTFESATGLAYYDRVPDGATKPESRTLTQIAVEGIYRFLPNEQMFIGARYNSLSGQLSPWFLVDGEVADVSSNRVEVVAGWFPIENLLLKASYVNQDYVDFPSSDLRHEGNFNGVIVEAAVGF